MNVYCIRNFNPYCDYRIDLDFINYKQSILLQTYGGLDRK